MTLFISDAEAMMLPLRETKTGASERVSRTRAMTVQEYTQTLNQHGNDEKHNNLVTQLMLRLLC